MDEAVYKLKILNENIKALKKLKNYIITYKLNIYNKLNWNTTLISFNSFLLNLILATVGIFSKTPQEFPGNGGS